MTPHRDRLLSTAKASPERVGEHDKAGWLALFTDDAIVEDPVGAAPNRRAVKDEIGRFYETFIAPNDIRFEVTQDIVAGDEVVRDVTIHTRMSSGLELAVPVLLIYEMAEGERGPLIKRLKAHWELPKMSWQTMMAGWKGLVTMTGQTWRMLKHQGVFGMMGYSKGMIRGIFGRGRKAVVTISDAVSLSDTASLEALFVDATARIEHPAGAAPMSPAQWLEGLGQGASLSVDKITPSGYTTGFRYSIEGDRASSGVAFLDFEPRSRKITSARFFQKD